MTYFNYTSGQFSGFGALVISGTLGDSLSILDGLLDHLRATEGNVRDEDVERLTPLATVTSTCTGATS